ncbi:MAG: hypothetical protein ACM3X7_08390 [Solirubrobacterales bacterium]
MRTLKRLKESLFVKRDQIELFCKKHVKRPSAEQILMKISDFTNDNLEIRESCQELKQKGIL